MTPSAPVPPRHEPAALLPDFPWDTIAGYKARAAEHPEGLIDLSVGSPVDRVALPIRTALSDASDAGAYPQVIGTPALRAAYTDWLARAHGVNITADQVLPTIGSKELVASLPTQLGFGPGHAIAIPELAYPTYQVGVLLAGCRMVRASPAALLADLTDVLVSMVWLNSPSNPTGAVIPPETLAKLVAWARHRGVIIASDECYLDLGWEVTPTSILDDEICGGDHTGLLALHSLSKRSNLAGYRLGFVAGDRDLIAGLVALRKHAGMMVPTPVQAAGVAALTDDAPALAQRARYGNRRAVLSAALSRAGFTIEESAAGLYLWCTRGERALDSVASLAERGILVAPGTFYGPAGSRHIRAALTATDEQIAAVASRLAL